MSGLSKHPNQTDPNGYFVDNGVIWQILNPVRMLAALTWAAGAIQTNVATSDRVESSGDS